MKNFKSHLSRSASGGMSCEAPKTNDIGMQYWSCESESTINKLKEGRRIPLKSVGYIRIMWKGRVMVKGSCITLDEIYNKHRMMCGPISRFIGSGC